MNQHVIDLYDDLLGDGFINSEIITICEHFNGKLLPEHRETYADLLLYAQARQTAAKQLSPDYNP